MKKSLLFCVMMMGSTVCLAEEKKNEKLPRITEQQNQADKEKHSELEKNIIGLLEQIDNEKAKKDAVEAEIDKYNRRLRYQGSLVLDLCDKEGALKAYKDDADKNIKQQNEDRELEDNGITGWWLTRPTEKSRGGLEYKRINALTATLLENNEKLFDEHVEYKNLMITKILVNLKEILTARNNTIETTYLVATKAYPSDPACLPSYGMTKKQLFGDFINIFMKYPYDVAYRAMEENKIPITRDELVTIAAANKITKEVVARINGNGEEYKKQIAEILNPKPKVENVVPLQQENKGDVPLQENKDKAQ